MQSILRGDSLRVFKATSKELMHPVNNNGDIEFIALSDETVLSRFNAEMVFPHRELDMQKQWMQHGLKKPKGLSFRNTKVAIGRLNNSIPYFQVVVKWKEEIIELLKRSIP